MQDNTQNKWKILLENPDSFAGEATRDKNETWEKLHARLHGKPRRKPGSWYWAAAACLIGAISVVMFSLNNEKPRISSVTILPIPKKQIPLTTETALNTHQNSEYVLSQRKQKNHTAVSRQKIVFVRTVPSVDKSFITDSIDENLTKMSIASIKVYDSSIKTVTAPVPAKKKLRLVHLNEIGQPAEEPTVNNRFAEKHGFEFRFINGEMYNPVNASSSNYGLILSKPRNTSN